MAAVTAAVVVAAGTAYAANRSSASARNAQRSADRNAATQADIDRQRLDFSRQQYDDWQGRFNPVWDRMSALAMEEEKPDYAAITADVAGAYDSARGVNARNMQRMGVKPTDGAAAAAETAYGLGRASSLVDARNRGRMSAREQYFNRISQLANIANGGQANATNLVNSAYAGASGGAGQRAGQQYGQAQFYQNQANQQWADAASSLGYGVGSYGGKASGGGGGGYSMPGYGPSYGYPGNPGSGNWGMTEWYGG
jgi:hypothetical protein